MRKTLILFALLILTASSSPKQEPFFRRAYLGMGIPEVKESEYLPFQALDEGTMKILQYRYPSPESDNAFVYYFFPEKNNFRLSIAGYIYYIEDDNARTLLVDKLTQQYSNIYGEGTYRNDANFKGYSWNLRDKALIIYNELGAQAVEQFYYDYGFVLQQLDDQYTQHQMARQQCADCPNVLCVPLSLSNFFGCRAYSQLDKI